MYYYQKQTNTLKFPHNTLKNIRLGAVKYIKFPTAGKNKLPTPSLINFSYNLVRRCLIWNEDTYIYINKIIYKLRKYPVGLNDHKYLKTKRKIIINMCLKL